MQEFVKNLAASERWTDEATVKILASTLDELLRKGLDRADVEEIIRREGGVEEVDDIDEGPEEGDVVHMRKEDVRIVVGEVPTDQAEAKRGIWWIISTDGDNHRIERDSVDDPWYVVVDGF